MRRSQLFTIALVLAAAACSKDKPPSTGPDDGDKPDASIGHEDAAASQADAAMPDAGPPPCNRDQDCTSGEVCNLAMSPAKCVAGRTCQNDIDCAFCYDLVTDQQVNCQHGFHLKAYCDATRGNVCTRELGPCEPCETDKECGTIHDSFGGAQNKCITYEDGKKYCGRASGGLVTCPAGFEASQAHDGQCVRLGGCTTDLIACPPAVAGQPCTGKDQICPGAECPATDGAKCSGNEPPGAIGVCVHFCDEDSDCPEVRPVCNKSAGICIQGCGPGTCPGNKVCHASGFCGAACEDNAACEDKYGADTYCNKAGQRPPAYYKTYHDRNSCRKKGCEKPEDCVSAGIVCDKQVRPYAECKPGCYETRDCLSGQHCKDPGPAGDKGSYSRAECRALAKKTDGAASVGVCCDPGCTNRNLQCGFNEWCCGEEDSPYENPSDCGPLMQGSPTAEPGECFDIAPPPFCAKCGDHAECNSGWTFGFNVDPNIGAGTPFQEQELCYPVAMGVNMCTVTCNPTLPENGNIGCPRLWSCQAIPPPCFADADCSGLTCEGADPANMRPGRCRCGTSGQIDAACPGVYANFPTVTNPRCVELGQSGEMYCIASYSCVPPPVRQDAQGDYNYPAICLQ